MKGVIVKNISMPKNCPMCPMSYWADNSHFMGCNVKGGKRYISKDDREFWESSTRPDWCPLMETEIEDE